jgi:predicted RNA methylase
MASDWHDWHSSYDSPASWQARRLVTVRDRIRAVLDAAPPGPLTALAMVAGQGRDLIPVLATHPRGGDVTARLVELDPRNADLARAGARAAGLPRVDVVTGDAAVLDHYAGLAPADLLLICGLFPHITDADVHQVVRAAPALVKRGGTVIWTRQRRAPDMVPEISSWFVDEGFAEVWVTDPATEHAVAVHRHLADPVPLAAGPPLFTFVGIQSLHPGYQRTT